MTETEHSATLNFDFGYGSKLDGAHGEFPPSIERPRDEQIADVDDGEQEHEGRGRLDEQEQGRGELELFAPDGHELEAPPAEPVQRLNPPRKSSSSSTGDDAFQRTIGHTLKPHGRIPLAILQPSICRLQLDHLEPYHQQENDYWFCARYLLLVVLP